jgi:hypothetical protein
MINLGKMTMIGRVTLLITIVMMRIRRMMNPEPNVHRITILLMAVDLIMTPDIITAVQDTITKTMEINVHAVVAQVTEAMEEEIVVTGTAMVTEMTTNVHPQERVAVPAVEEREKEMAMMAMTAMTEVRTLQIDVQAMEEVGIVEEAEEVEETEETIIVEEMMEETTTVEDTGIINTVFTGEDITETVLVKAMIPVITMAALVTETMDMDMDMDIETTNPQNTIIEDVADAAILATATMKTALMRSVRNREDHDTQDTDCVGTMTPYDISLEAISHVVRSGYVLIQYHIVREDAKY